MATCKVKVCRICFAMDCQLHLLHEDMKLYKAYEAVTALVLADEEDLPPYLCTSCADQLMTCARFRHRSLQAHLMLLDILKNHDSITVKSIRDVLKATHCDNKHIEDEILVSNIKIEIQDEDIPEDPIATDLSDNIKTENIPDDELNGDKTIAPCVEENDKVKEEEILEVSVNPTELCDNIKTEYISDDGANDRLSGDGAATPSAVGANNIVKEKVFLKVSAKDNEDDGTMGTGLLRIKPSKNALKCRKYRDRKKAASHKVKAAPKTAVERNRLYRMRKKQLALANKSANEVAYTPSTSNTRMTFKPYSQPATAGEDGSLHDYLCSAQEDMLKMAEAREGMEATKNFKVDVIQQRVAEVKRKLLQNAKLSSDLCGNDNDSQTQFLSPLQSESKIDILAHAIVHSGYKSHSSNVPRSSRKSSNSTKVFSCDLCKKSFARKNALKRHILKHTDDTPYTCEVCGKSLSSDVSLKRHMLLHSEDKQFPCYVCNKSYHQKTSLQYHLQTHVGTTPFPCNICEKPFATKNSLKTHMLLHAEKQYPCDMCDKSFTGGYGLRRHKLSHSGRKRDPLM